MNALSTGGQKPPMAAKLSLIVCTLNRQEHLARLLTSLQAQRERRFEIVVVDQNAPGFLEALLAPFAELNLLHVRSRRGLSRARNIGLQHCSGEIVAFPDDDCWYGPGVTADAVAFFAHFPEHAFRTGRTVSEDGRDSVSPHMDASGEITRGNVFSAGNSNTLFVRRECAEHVGGFDEGLGVGASTPYQSGEETDFLLRCLGAGLRGFYDRGFTVFHDQNSAPVEIGRARLYASGYGRVIRAHGYGAAHLGVRVTRALLRSILCIASGDLAGARARYAWIAGSVQGFFAPPGGAAPQTTSLLRGKA